MMYCSSFELASYAAMTALKLTETFHSELSKKIKIEQTVDLINRNDIDIHGNQRD